MTAVVVDAAAADPAPVVAGPLPTAVSILASSQVDAQGWCPGCPPIVMLLLGESYYIQATVAAAGAWAAALGVQVPPLNGCPGAGDLLTPPPLQLYY